MDSVTLARAIGVARIGFGLGLIAEPERLTRVWVGRDAGRAGTQVAVRGLGGRDLVLGTGAAATTGSEQRRWVTAAVVADAADLLATLAAGSRLPLRGRVLVGLVAGAGVAGGLAALSGLRRPAR